MKFLVIILILCVIVQFAHAGWASKWLSSSSSESKSDPNALRAKRYKKYISNCNNDQTELLKRLIHMESEKAMDTLMYACTKCGCDAEKALKMAVESNHGRMAIFMFEHPKEFGIVTYSDDLFTMLVKHDMQISAGPLLTVKYAKMFPNKLAEIFKTLYTMQYYSTLGVLLDTSEDSPALAEYYVRCYIDSHVQSKTRLLKLINSYRPIVVLQYAIEEYYKNRASHENAFEVISAFVAASPSAATFISTSPLAILKTHVVDEHWARSLVRATIQIQYERSKHMDLSRKDRKGDTFDLSGFTTIAKLNPTSAKNILVAIADAHNLLQEKKYNLEVMDGGSDGLVRYRQFVWKLDLVDVMYEILNENKNSQDGSLFKYEFLKGLNVNGLLDEAFKIGGYPRTMNA